MTKLSQIQKHFIGLLLVLVTLYLSFNRPGDEPPKFPFIRIDLIGHFIAYFSLGFWYQFTLRKHLLVFILLLCFGVFIEIGQSFTSYRSYENLDILMDGLGVIFGQFFLNIYFRLFHKDKFHHL